MKASILGVFLILLIPAVCSAGEESIATQKKQSDANITEHVVDAKTREHLAFATIAVKGTTIGIATDATGHYFLKNLPQGRFTLVASSVGECRTNGGNHPRQDHRGQFRTTGRGSFGRRGGRFGKPHGDQQENITNHRICSFDKTLRIYRLMQFGRNNEFPVRTAR